MPTAVLTRATSGIGHAFTKQLISEWQRETVSALDLNVGQELRDLQCERFECDLTFSDSIAQSCSYFRLRDESLDILFNFAGVTASKVDDALASIASSTLLSIFQAISFGLLLLTRPFLSAILKA
ncbi:MAG: hypothetical protein Q9208_004790 [Pyrenodesmia sp. 3 TL-2023]